MFHGGGREVASIAAPWSIDPPGPVPGAVQNHLLVFPESHPQLDDEWVYYGPGNGAFPPLDLDFVRTLVAELTTRAYSTTSAAVPTATADPTRIYAASFSNGGRNSLAVAELRSQRVLPRLRGRHPGAADTGYRPPFTQQEPKLDETLPPFTLTEVVLQELAGTEASLHGTVINGGHNWPTPTSVGNPPVAAHCNATEAIVKFWRANAGLP